MKNNEIQPKEIAQLLDSNQMSHLTQQIQALISQIEDRFEDQASLQQSKWIQHLIDDHAEWGQFRIYDHPYQEIPTTVSIVKVWLPKGLIAGAFTLSRISTVIGRTITPADLDVLYSGQALTPSQSSLQFKIALAVLVLSLVYIWTHSTYDTVKEVFQSCDVERLDIDVSLAKALFNTIKDHDLKKVSSDDLIEHLRKISNDQKEKQSDFQKFLNQSVTVCLALTVLGLVLSPFVLKWMMALDFVMKVIVVTSSMLFIGGVFGGILRKAQQHYRVWAGHDHTLTIFEMMMRALGHAVASVNGLIMNTLICFCFGAGGVNTLLTALGYDPLTGWMLGCVMVIFGVSGGYQSYKFSGDSIKKVFSRLGSWCMNPTWNGSAMISGSLSVLVGIGSGVIASYGMSDFLNTLPFNLSSISGVLFGVVFSFTLISSALLYADFMDRLMSRIQFNRAWIKALQPYLILIGSMMLSGIIMHAAHVPMFGIEPGWVLSAMTALCAGFCCSLVMSYIDSRDSLLVIKDYLGMMCAMVAGVGFALAVYSFLSETMILGSFISLCVPVVSVMVLSIFYYAASVQSDPVIEQSRLSQFKAIVLERSPPASPTSSPDVSEDEDNTPDHGLNDSKSLDP